MLADVTIVGGGPVGCMTAAAIGKRLSTVVLEEHDRIGVPEQCAGLIAPRVVDMVGAKGAVLNSIDGVLLHFPDGRTLRLKGKEVKAYVVERRQFDETCLDRALSVGADYRVRETFVRFGRKDGKVTVVTENGNVFESSIAIGADGYRSSFGKAAGLPPADEVVKGVQVDLEVKAEDMSSVEVWLGQDVAPGFFAWSIPCGDFTRIGLCVSESSSNPFGYLKNLLKRTGLDDAKRLASYSGAIPIGPASRTVGDNVMLVGDAAGQAKPLSGGGLFTGITAASIAGEVCRKAIESGDVSRRSLREYERRWRGSFGSELKRGLMLRRMYTRMSDDALNDVGGVLDTEKCRKALSEGDIDHPTAIARDVLSAAPGLLRFSPYVLAALLQRGTVVRVEMP
ncbi:MAG: NAD(P)/FAD-dependent oxidoreductase [Methanomassiliicoccales archaeon]|jgi:geranylgeranyl reductase family protein